MAKIKGTKKQARKRHRQAQVRRTRNRAVRSRVRNQVRRLRAAMEAGELETARELLPKTMSVIDVACRKGVLHRNTASRYKARVSKGVAALAAAGSDS